MTLRITILYGAPNSFISNSDFPVIPGTHRRHWNERNYIIFIVGLNPRIDFRNVLQSHPLPLFRNIKGNLHRSVAQLFDSRLDVDLRHERSAHSIPQNLLPETFAAFTKLFVSYPSPTHFPEKFIKLPNDAALFLKRRQRQWADLQIFCAQTLLTRSSLEVLNPIINKPLSLKKG